MKLGLAIGYSGGTLDVPVALVQRAEALGYDTVWTAEAYGSDAVTPLAFLAAQTRRIRLGTGVMQLAARTPANAAMCAATVDALAGGNRFIAGLGVSGPQIVEGWYGQPWGRPYYRVSNRGKIPGGRHFWASPDAGQYDSLRACPRPPIRPVCHAPSSKLSSWNC